MGTGQEISHPSRRWLTDLITHPFDAPFVRPDVSRSRVLRAPPPLLVLCQRPLAHKGVRHLCGYVCGLRSAVCGYVCGYVYVCDRKELGRERWAIGKASGGSGGKEAEEEDSGGRGRERGGEGEENRTEARLKKERRARTVDADCLN